MSDVQLSDQGQDQGCKIQNKIQEPCKPTNTTLLEFLLSFIAKVKHKLRLSTFRRTLLALFSCSQNIVFIGKSLLPKQRRAFLLDIEELRSDPS
jgi:hypothetical protein